MGSLLELEYIGEINECILTTKNIDESDECVEYGSYRTLQDNLRDLDSIVKGEMSTLTIRVDISKCLVRCLTDLLIIYKDITGNTNADYLSLHETLSYLEILKTVVDTSTPTGSSLRSVPITIIDTHHKNLLRTVIEQFIATADIHLKISMLDRVFSIYLVIMGLALDVDEFKRYINKKIC